MDITEVRITLRDEGRLRAFASITFDNWFVVRGLKIIESTNGTFMDDERIHEVSIDNRSKFRVGSHVIALMITDRDE